MTAEFIGCDLAWDESGNHLVSATVNGTPIPPGALQVFQTRQGRGRRSTKFTVDLPGGSSVVTSIRVVIDTKPIPYGNRSETKLCVLLNNEPLMQSICIELEPAPVFYNAFPDLNGVAEDGSYSVAPTGAKYMLPLACVFNPYATYKKIHVIDPVAEANSEIYRWGKEEHGEAYRPVLAVWRKPELAGECVLSALFERVHARLAGTTYKLMFRADLLGPFYHTLYEFLSSEHKIRVPLLANSKGSKLQRQWDEIKRWFLGTCVLDEACSLLVVIAFIADKQGRDQYERIWVKAEDQEMQGKFAPFYRKLKSKVEFLYGGNLDSCVMKNERFTFAEVALTFCAMLYHKVACTGSSDLEKSLDDNSEWSDLKKILDRLPSLYTHPYRGWEKLQAALGLHLLYDEDRQTFIDELKFGPNAPNSLIRSFRNSKGPRHFPMEYFFCQSESTREDVSRIDIAPARLLIDLLISQSATPDDPTNKDRFEIMVFYMIFLESIRQQICQGVGLRCPFWNGECCQTGDAHKGFKELLEKTYKITKPWKWPQHWQKPPCLDEVN